MHVLIATPTASHMVTTAYSASLIAATQAIHAQGGSYDHMVFNGSDVVLARNYLAHACLNDPEFTHLLFLDSDMLVERPVFERLLAAGHDIAGVIYSGRSLRRETYISALRAGASAAQAEATALTFNARPIDGGYLVRDGWCEVAGLGAGCLLIARSVLERLIAHGALAPYRNARLEQQLGPTSMQDFFGLIALGGGEHLSEDYAFCHRVREAGMNVMGLADAAVGHVGRQIYSASFIDHLQSHAQKRPQK